MSQKRSLKPIVLGIGLLLCLPVFCALIFQPTEDFNAKLHGLVEKSRRILAYTITVNQTSIFKILPQDEKIEVVSNLNVYTEDLEEINASGGPLEFEYEIDVTLVDADGTELKQLNFYENTIWSQWSEGGAGPVKLSAFYLDRAELPCESRISTFSLPKDRKDETFLVVRLKSPEDGSASIRTYRHIDQSGSSHFGSTKPISGVLCSKFIRHNLFGRNSREIEIKRFLNDVWDQIPAEGRSNIDYETTEIFLLDETKPLQGLTPESSGHLLDSQHPLYINVSDLSKIDFSYSENASLTIESAGFFNSPECTSIQVNKNEIVPYTIPDQTALLSIRTNDSTSGRLSLYPNNSIGIQSTNYYRVVPSGSGDPLKISVTESISGNIEPIKMICRQPKISDNETAACTLVINFIRNSGEIVSAQQMKCKSTVSSYAAYSSISETSRENPSFPEKFFIFPPKNTDYIELTSNLPLDIALFSNCQPYQSEQSVNLMDVDEEIQGHSELKPTRYDGWYYFRPDNADFLEKANRIATVRLPENFFDSVVETRNEDETVGFEAIAPGSAEYETIYDPVPENAPAGQWTIYAKLKNDNIYRTIISKSANPYQTLLIKYNINLSPGKVIEFFVDGVRKISFRPLSEDGKFLLPPLGEGTHTIRIKSGHSDDAFTMRLYDGIDIQTDKYVVRRVYSLKPAQELKIPFTKTSDEQETLNIIAYSSGQENISGLTVKLTEPSLNVEPLITRNLTQRMVTYRNLPYNEDQLPVKGSSNVLLRSQTLFFTLHDDLPPGNYTISVISHCDKPVFLRTFKALS